MLLLVVSRKQAKKALKLKWLLWRGSYWNSGFESIICSFKPQRRWSLLSHGTFRSLDQLQDVRQAPLTWHGARGATDMKTFMLSPSSSSHLLFAHHVSCAGIGRLQVPSLLHLFTSPSQSSAHLALCHPFPGFRDQPYYPSLYRLSHIQTDFNHTLIYSKMQKSKEKLLDPHFKITNGWKITYIKIN